MVCCNRFSTGFVSFVTSSCHASTPSDTYHLVHHILYTILWACLHCTTAISFLMPSLVTVLFVVLWPVGNTESTSKRILKYPIKPTNPVVHRVVVVANRKIDLERTVRLYPKRISKSTPVLTSVPVSCRVEILTSSWSYNELLLERLEMIRWHPNKFTKVSNFVISVSVRIITGY